MGLFSFVKRPFPNPGTGNFAYVQNTAFPMFDAGGAGRRVFNNLNVQHANVVQTNVVSPNGFGGLLQGQFAGQSLMEPDRGI